MDVVDAAHRHGHAVEVGRVLDVGGGAVPGVEVTLGRSHRIPARIALEHVGVVVREQLRPQGGGDHVADLPVARPDIAQVYRLAVAAGAQRFAGQVDVHGAGDGVGHHQRRGGEVVHLHLGVDSAFEVAVARQHRRHRQVVLGDAPGHRFGQRSGVADAGGAAVADDVEAQLLQILEHAGLAQVIGDHPRAGAERGLHPRCGLQAAGHRVARQQAGAEHHRRIGGVGAGGDGGDHHRAVGQVVFAVVDADPGHRFGRQPVGLGLPATFGGQLLIGAADGAVGDQAGDVAVEVVLHVLQQDPVLRPPGTGQ